MTIGGLGVIATKYKVRIEVLDSRGIKRVGFSFGCNVVHSSKVEKKIEESIQSFKRLMKGANPTSIKHIVTENSNIIEESIYQLKFEGDTYELYGFGSLSYLDSFLNEAALRGQIDLALERGDKELFMELASKLNL